MEVASDEKHNYEAEAAQVARELGLDFAKLDFDIHDLARGIKVEYEHGSRDPRTNVTDDDLMKTAKIALAHLYKPREDGYTYYDYYDGLECIEDFPVGFFRTRNPRDSSGAPCPSIPIMIFCIFIIAIFALLVRGNAVVAGALIAICLCCIWMLHSLDRAFDAPEKPPASSL